jgi:hypothetical protein
MADELAGKSAQKGKSLTSKGTGSANMVLSGLYYQYSRFRSDALSTNRIKVVNNTYDDKYTNGVWQNPYETRTAFVLSTPIMEMNKAGLSLSLPATVWHTNQAANISSIEVDFGNGSGYISLNNGASANTTYTSIGTYTLTYRLKLTNNTFLYCRQKLKVNTVSPSLTAKNSFPVTTQNITATRTYLGVAGSATLQIANGSSDNKIRKPLIVVEGLDTGILEKSGRLGDTDYFTFEREVINNSGSELRNLITNNTSIDYDVIYVNWDNGTDHIQRNAFVLQAVINWVNAQKAANGSTTPNVVLGQSMGGIVARYALKDMENRGELHKTSLYISHDAPHQGAHIPLGILHFGRHMLDQFIKTPVGSIDIPVNSGTVGLLDLKELLDAPATRQLLVKSVNSNFQEENNSAFLSELRTMGYPIQTRNIALSNASHCAQPQGVTAGSRIFDATANGRTTFLTDLVLALTPLGAISGAATSIVLDDPGFLLGILPGRSKLDVDFRVNAYPTSGTAQIYYGRIRYTKNLLWVVPINKDITLRQVNSVAGTLPLDSYPGGVSPSFSGVNVSAFRSSALAKFGYTVNLNPEFNFIPAVSALDVGRGNTTLTGTDYTARYSAATPPTGTRATPFANFSTSYNTSGFNESHISFNARNGKWLASELDAVSGSDVFDCSFICSPPSMAGPTNICTTATYSLSAPTGTPVTWSVTPANAATFPAGASSSKIFTKNSTFNGNATISATISTGTSGCGTVLVTKAVNVGPPSGVLTLTTYGPDQYGLLSVLVSGGSPPYRYYNYNGTLLTSNLPNVELNWGCDLNRLFVDAQTPCGTATVFSLINQGCGNARTSSTQVFPNPASDQIFVAKVLDEKKDSNGFSESSLPTFEDVTLELYDYTGTIVKSEIYRKGNIELRLGLSEFKKGRYFLRIVGKEIDETHQIVIE